MQQLDTFRLGPMASMRGSPLWQGNWLTKQQDLSFLYKYYLVLVDITFKELSPLVRLLQRAGDFCMDVCVNAP